MKWKTTLVLLAATLALGAYVSLYDLRQPTSEQAQQRAKRIVKIDPNAVTQLALDLPNAKTTLTRSGGGWTISPRNLRADAALVETLLDEFFPLASERTLTPAPDRPLNLKEFGLEPAIGWVSLVTKGGTTTLLFGEATPVGRGRYVKRSDAPEVFIISPRPFDSLNQPGEQLRDRRLLRLSGWTSHQVTLASPEHAYDLQRIDNAWKLAAPVADEADRAAVSALLGHLERLEIRRFVTDEPPAPLDPAWGLDQPTTRLTVRAGDPAQEITVALGKPLKEDKTLVYAARSDEPSIYAIAAADLEPLMKPADELRNKACFSFFTGNVTKVSVRWGAASWTIRRDGEAWTAQEAATPQRSQVETFLSTLADARLERFVEGANAELARYGLEQPDGAVEIWTGEEGPPQQLHLGAPVKSQKTRYGRLMPRGAVVVLPEPLVATVSTTTLERLSASP